MSDEEKEVILTAQAVRLCKQARGALALMGETW